MTGGTTDTLRHLYYPNPPPDSADSASADPAPVPVASSSSSTSLLTQQLATATPLQQHHQYRPSPLHTNMAAAAVTVSPEAASMASTQPLTEDSKDSLPRPYQCPLCTKAFHRLEHQTRHIRTHTGEKPHACQFPGCTKRFSRSDELTRHSRIHSNPNSRRSKAAHNVSQTQAAAMQYAQTGGYEDMHLPPQMALPPGQYPLSAPNSSMVSPDASPPHTYSSYPGKSAFAYPRDPRDPRGGYDKTNIFAQHQQQQLQQQPARGINLLATAATQVEDERRVREAQYQPRRSSHHANHHPHHHHPYSQPNGGSPASSRLPSISAYAYSAHSMSRSHSTEGHHDDHYTTGRTERSRPSSPQSTAPTSPTYSNCESCSPTPGHTPAITPAHSPRLRPQDVHLPGIRHLTIGNNHLGGFHVPHAPMHQYNSNTLAVPDTLEPTADASTNTSHTNSINSSYSGVNLSASSNTHTPGSSRTSANPSPTHKNGQQHPPPQLGPTPYNRSANSSGMRITEIISHGPDANGRTLPVPITSGGKKGSAGSGVGRGNVSFILNEADGMDES